MFDYPRVPAPRLMTGRSSHQETGFHGVVSRVVRARSDLIQQHLAILQGAEGLRAPMTTVGPETARFRSFYRSSSKMVSLMVL